MNQNVSTLKELEKWVVAPSQPQEAVVIKLEEINDSINNLKSVETRPQYAFENSTAIVGEKKQQLLQEKQKAERDLLNYQMAEKGYQELDYSPLGWLKWRSMLPAFFIVNINHSSVVLNVHVSWGSIDSFCLLGEKSGPAIYEYPKAISRLYGKAAAAIFKSERRGYDEGSGYITARAQYQGILPDKTRSKIETALQAKLFDGIYIIAEAKDWKIKKTVVTRADPLVVGWVERTEQMFIIDVFDPTPLEDYLVMSHSIVKS